MITSRRSFPIAVLASAILIIPAVAAGQMGTGPLRVGGLISGSAGAGNSALTLGASASYRLMPRLSVEGDVSHFSDLTLAEFPGPAPTQRISFHARTTAATVNAVFDLPGGVRWLRPYIAGGGGAALVRRDARGLSGVRPEPRNDTRPLLSAGGGVDVLLGRGVAVGLDFRYQRIYEDQASFQPNLRNLKRLGSFVSVRF